MQQSAQPQQYEPREVRRSFTLLAMDVIFYMCGLAFLDASTVLPKFLSTLTGSTVLIGTIIAIRPAFALLPQLWTAHYLRNRTQHKSFLMKVATISRTAITLFAVVLFIAGPQSRTLMLAAFVVMYVAFWLSEGWAGVPWTDLVAKTIPERLRGKLFGLTQFVGGILSALIAAQLISWGLSDKGPSYPTNYAILMAVAAFFFITSLISLQGVREPAGPAEERGGGFLSYARQVVGVLAGHSQFKKLLGCQLLIGFIGMSLPFYILYAQEVARIGGREVAWLLSVQLVGSIIVSFVAGYISDHWSPKAAIVVSILSGITAPVIALLAGASSIWVYALIFFGLGGINGSSWVGLTSELLEIAEPSERRSYIGVMNTANTPTMVFPILGGWIAEAVSYQAVFAVTAVALFLSLLMALSLKHTRGSTPQTED